MFATPRTPRDAAVDTLARATAATRRAASEVAEQLDERTAALGRRGADPIVAAGDVAGDAIRARPLVAVAIAATYLACRSRD